MSNIPNLDDMFSCKSYDELSKIVNDWIGGDGDDDDSENSQSSTVDSPSQSSASSAMSTNESGYNSLDDAFADLMSD